jgi:hypothetical protein
LKLDTPLRIVSAQIKRTEAEEMKLLRHLAGHTLSDHIKNEDICRKLETEKVTNKISTYRNNWLDHLERMTPERIPYKLLTYKLRGKRSRERPKKRYKDQFQTLQFLKMEQTNRPNPCSY